MKRQTGVSIPPQRSEHRRPQPPPPDRVQAPGAVPPSERHVWAIAALFFPLVFCAIVGLGVFLMLHRQMAFFKPAPSGNAAPSGKAATSGNVAPARPLAAFGPGASASA